MILSNQEEKVKLNIWDTGNSSLVAEKFTGQAGIFYFKSITKSHYRRSHGAIIVFDANKQQTYDDAMGMIDEYKTFCQRDSVLLVVANKCNFS